MAFPTSTLVNETARAERQAAAARPASSASQPGAAPEASASFVQMLADQQGSGATPRPQPDPSGGAGAGRESAASQRLADERSRTQREAGDAAARARLDEARSLSGRAASQRPASSTPSNTTSGRAQSSDDTTAQAAAEAAETGSPPEDTVAQAQQQADTLAQWLQQIGVLPQGTAKTQALGAREDGVAAGGPAADGAAPGDAQVAGAGPMGADAVRAGQGLARGRAAVRDEGGPLGGGREDMVGSQRSGSATGALESGEAHTADAASAAAPSPPTEPVTPREGAVSLAGFEAVFSAAMAGGEVAGGRHQSPEVAVVAQAEIGTAFDAPGAGDEVVLQVSRWVRDGVGEARLHLNPVEMGPIEVRIALDGTQARVEFAAAQEATRELLQAHVPALAQALQAEGLTLAGSAVSAQVGHEGEGADAGGSAGGAPGQPDTGAGTGGSGGRSGAHPAESMLGSRWTEGAARRLGWELQTDVSAPDSLPGPGGSATHRRALDLYA